MIYKTLFKPVSSEYYLSTESITWVLPNYSVPATQKTSECASLFLTYLACIKECSTMIRVSGIWFFSETRLCGEGADLPTCWRLGIHLWSFHTKWPRLSDHFFNHLVTNWSRGPIDPIDREGHFVTTIFQITIASFEFYEHVQAQYLFIWRRLNFLRVLSPFYWVLVVPVVDAAWHWCLWFHIWHIYFDFNSGNITSKLLQWSTEKTLMIYDFKEMTAIKNFKKVYDMMRWLH